MRALFDKDGCVIVLPSRRRNRFGSAYAAGYSRSPTRSDSRQIVANDSLGV